MYKRQRRIVKGNKRGHGGGGSTSGVDRALARNKGHEPAPEIIVKSRDQKYHNNGGVVIDTDTGQALPKVGGGLINPDTGQFLPKVAGGYINPETGAFIPSN